MYPENGFIELEYSVINLHSLIPVDKQVKWYRFLTMNSEDNYGGVLPKSQKLQQPVNFYKETMYHEIFTLVMPLRLVEGAEKLTSN